jgi:sec-independent protein translocase protein TatA
MFSGALNPLHIMVVLVIALLVFGPKRLPELGRSIGSGFRELKDSLAGEGHDDAEPAERATLATAAQPEPAPEQAPQSPSTGV